MNDLRNDSSEDLNRRFAIPGVAEVIAGNGNLPKIRLTTPAVAAEIYLHGAQVTSWQPAGAEEVLFLSECSNWQEGRAIRGGIPICFPWFRGKRDDPQAPAHGVVRTKAWRLDSLAATQDGSVTVVCSTASDELTRRWWPHEFHLEYRITCGPALCLELTVTNTGSAPFQFEEALHTYFRVGSVRDVRILGLDGVSFLDNTDSNRENLQTGPIVISRPTDSAYLNTQSAIDLVDPVLHRTLRTEKENSATTVVWNPWQDGAAALSDLGSDEWPRMACVEASNILAAAVTVGPGARHTMRAILSVLPDAM